MGLNLFSGYRATLSDAIRTRSAKNHDDSNRGASGYLILITAKMG